MNTPFLLGSVLLIIVLGVSSVAAQTNGNVPPPRPDVVAENFYSWYIVAAGAADAKVSRNTATMTHYVTAKLMKQLNSGAISSPQPFPFFPDGHIDTAWLDHFKAAEPCDISGKMVVFVTFPTFRLMVTFVRDPILWKIDAVTDDTEKNFHCRRP